MCDPILVTPLKMRAHYSQSNREYATPSSGTSPLVSYKYPRGYGEQSSLQEFAGIQKPLQRIAYLRSSIINQIRPR